MLENLNLKTGQIVGMSSEAGKIVNNYECYIVCPMDSKRAKECKIGDKLEVRVDDGDSIAAEIEYIIEEDNSRLIVFKIEKNIEKLINYRKIAIDVIWWNKNGWKVPISTLYEESLPIINNQENQVEEDRDKIYYVVRNRGGYLHKIFVKVLKQNDTYAIIDNYTSSELKELGYTNEELKDRNTLKLYDELQIPKGD